MIKDGVIQFDGVSIAPNMKYIGEFDNDLFTKVDLGDTVFYLSKDKNKIGNMLFWVRITIAEGTVKTVELRNAENKYKMDYFNMTDALLDNKYRSHNIFLNEYVGKPDNESLGGKEYIFEWGKIYSYKDIKTGDCGIIFQYNH